VRGGGGMETESKRGASREKDYCLNAAVTNLYTGKSRFLGIGR